jgi:hypothetical protein
MLPKTAWPEAGGTETIRKKEISATRPETEDFFIAFLPAGNLDQYSPAAPQMHGVKAASRNSVTRVDPNAKTHNPTPRELLAQ